jgi:hypothetical protein
MTTKSEAHIAALAALFPLLSPPTYGRHTAR